MCRIFGWTGELHSPEQLKKVSLLIKGLILSEEERNPHGTGLCVYSQSSGHQLLKKGLRGSAFVLRGYPDAVLKIKMRSVIGHVRFKTSGEQSDKNAHPFGFRIKGEWMFGIHNGIIGCANALTKKYNIKPFAVDSATFFACLAKVAESKGLEEAIEEVSYEASLTGDFAFAILKKGEIYLWRNEARPLCFFDLRKEGLGRVFCSTREMFEKAVSLAGLKFKEVPYFEAKPHRLYKVGHKTTPRNFEVEVVKELKHKEKPILQPYTYYSPLSSKSEIKKMSLRKLEEEIMETEEQLEFPSDPELRRYHDILFTEYQRRRMS